MLVCMVWCVGQCHCQAQLHVCFLSPAGNWGAECCALLPIGWVSADLMIIIIIKLFMAPHLVRLRA